MIRVRREVGVRLSDDRGAVVVSAKSVIGLSPTLIRGEGY